MLKILCDRTHNLGDFINVMPVFSGLAKACGDTIRLVVSDQHKKIKGFREFFEYQPMFHEVLFRSEVFGMREETYTIVSYSEEEFKFLTERPNRPIETLRHEKFVRDNYQHLTFEVDDDLILETDETIDLSDWSKELRIVGDRWSSVIDTRRSWNILKDSGHFDDEKFHFLDYDQSLMWNASIIKYSNHPFIGTFTGSGMLADLLGVENWCFYDQSMIDPPWNGMPIEYSYWKHYYSSRNNHLCHVNDPVVSGYEPE